LNSSHSSGHQSADSSSPRTSKHHLQLLGSKGNIQESDTHLKDNIFVPSMQSIRKAMDISATCAPVKSVHSQSSLFSPKCCPICFNEYQVGEDIAWSCNEICYHAFHYDCILHWLLNHDDCPMCRSDYLCLECSC